MKRNCRIASIVASLVVLACMLAGCEKTKNPVDMKEADRDDAVLVAITRDGEFLLGPEIRVRDASKVDLTDVVVDREKFGDIKQETTTEYRKSTFAHRNPSASVLVNSKPLQTAPI